MLTDGVSDAHAEYVPTYDEPQLFRWRGYWAEVKKSKPTNSFMHGIGNHISGGLHLT